MYDFEFNITVDDQFFDRINYTLNMTDYFGGGKRFTITNEKHSHYVKKLELRVRWGNFSINVWGIDTIFIKYCKGEFKILSNIYDGALCGSR